MHARHSLSLFSPRRWSIGLSRLHRRLKQRRIPHYVQIDLGEKVTERKARAAWLTPLLGPSPQSLEDLRMALRAVATDPIPEGLVLRIDNSDLTLHNAQSIIGFLAEFRQLDRQRHARSGAAPKRIVCFLHLCTTASYLIATAADHIVLSPVTPWDLTGLSQRSMYLHRMLDKLGLDFEVVRAGRWKTAPNALTADYMDPHERSHLLAVLQSLYDQIVAQITQGRGLSHTTVQAALDEGPLLAEDALQHQLVDDVCAWSRLPARLAREPSAQDKTLVPYAKVRGLLRKEYRRRHPKMIAVISVQGILNLGSHSARSRDNMSHHRDLLAAIQTAREKKDRLAGVILYVDSPGGSALASHIVHDALRQLRDDMPLVVYMGKVAASGGYYLAMAGQHVIAQAATLTGSIGVFLGKPLTHRLQGKLGIQVSHLQLGTNAGIFDPALPLSTGQRALLQRHVDHIYADFRRVVQAGRNMDRGRVDELAEGRVWTGQQALERNLVDEIGTFARAVEYIRTQAGIPDDRQVRVRDLQARPWLSSLYPAMAHSRLWRQLLPWWSRYLPEMVDSQYPDHLWMLDEDLVDQTL